AARSPCYRASFRQVRFVARWGLERRGSILNSETAYDDTAAREVASMIENLTPASPRLNQRTIASIVAFAILYETAVLGLQLTKWFGAPPAVAIIGEYSGAIAVALCVVAAILVCKMTGNRRLRIIALAAAAVFAA